MNHILKYDDIYDSLEVPDPASLGIFYFKTLARGPLPSTLELIIKLLMTSFMDSHQSIAASIFLSRHAKSSHFAFR